MTTSYDRRLTALEQRHNRAAPPQIRIIRTIICPDRGVVGMLMRCQGSDQSFDRAEGESEDQLRQRAMRAVGWD